MILARHRPEPEKTSTTRLKNQPLDWSKPPLFDGFRPKDNGFMVL
jgi:hypothetical protein